MADVVITDVSLAPNPVNTNAEYMISVGVIDKVYGILAKDGKLLMSTDDKILSVKQTIERIHLVETKNDKALSTKEGKQIQMKVKGA